MSRPAHPVHHLALHRYRFSYTFSIDIIRRTNDHVRALVRGRTYPELPPMRSEVQR